jgi:hypothetical protein
MNGGPKEVLLQRSHGTEDGVLGHRITEIVGNRSVEQWKSQRKLNRSSEEFIVGGAWLTYQTK